MSTTGILKILRLRLMVIWLPLLILGMVLSLVAPRAGAWPIMLAFKIGKLPVFVQ